MHWENCHQIAVPAFDFTRPINHMKCKATLRDRVEICRDRHDRRSCKICASCVNFPGNQRDVSHNLRRTTRFIHTKCDSGLHKLWYPGIRDRSTWGKFGAHGEHGDVFLFSNLGALGFSENHALVLWSIAYLFMGSQEQFFSFRHTYLRHFSCRF